MPVALEGQDDVHQVFQQAGAGDGAVLGDMAHQEGGHAALLGGADQRAGDLPDLGHAAGGAVDLGGGDGLHGVEDQQRRLHRVQVAQHGGQIGLGGQVQMVVRAPIRSARSRTWLALLARDVQGAVLLARRLGGHVQQQRGLADAGLAREQHHRAGHQSAAEHPVQLGHAEVERAVACSWASTWPMGTAERARRRRTDRGRAVLLDRPPRLALGAATEPLGRLPAALGAASSGRSLVVFVRAAMHETVTAPTDTACHRRPATASHRRPPPSRTGGPPPSRTGCPPRHADPRATGSRGSCPLLRDRFTRTD
ncbi:hypothetical protein SFUMM280S_00790 [Streptomyces fumanus]